MREVGPVVTARVADASAAARPSNGTQSESSGPVRALDVLLDGDSGTGRRAVEAGRASGSKSLATAIVEAQAKLSKPIVAQPAPKRPARGVSHEER